VPTRTDNVGTRRCAALCPPYNHAISIRSLAM
jgi:hypothetical protein